MPKNIESKQNHSVLIVEDNQDIALQIGHYLEQQGLITDFAHLGSTALNLIEDQSYDLIVLDLMLPDMDGLTICEHIKQRKNINIPILMLTARDSTGDKIAGFDAGTDDYLTKPFALEELFVRCKALLRRKTLHLNYTIELGDLLVDTRQRKVSRLGQDIQLSATDYEIIKILAEEHPNPVSKRQLSERIWGEDQPDSDALRTHIYTLRNAIDKPFNKKIIKTLHGIGFKLDPDER